MSFPGKIITLNVSDSDIEVSVDEVYKKLEKIIEKENIPKILENLELNFPEDYLYKIIDNIGGIVKINLEYLELKCLKKVRIKKKNIKHKKEKLNIKKNNLLIRLIYIFLI